VGSNVSQASIDVAEIDLATSMSGGTNPQVLEGLEHQSIEPTDSLTSMTRRVADHGDGP
jgi:hypothetical protein